MAVHKPSDPLNQLMAEAHIYGKNTCDTTTCFTNTLAPVAASVPLLFGETGETYDASSCGSTNISTFMNWLTPTTSATRPGREIPGATAAR